MPMKSKVIKYSVGAIIVLVAIVVYMGNSNPLYLKLLTGNARFLKGPIESQFFEVLA